MVDAATPSTHPRDTQPRGPRPTARESGAGDRTAGWPDGAGRLHADLLRGLVEIRHVAGSTRAAYDQIFATSGMSHPDHLWDDILRRLDVSAGMTLLDVACGEGELLRRAVRLGLVAYGVDLSEEALRHAASPRVHTSVVNGEALPFPEGAFDRVVCFGSLEHYEDPVVGAAELARVLAPHGRALLQLPNTFGFRWNVMHAWRTGDVADDGQPIQRYGTLKQWQAILRAGGLITERVEPYEDERLAPRGVAGWLGAAARPSRLLIPLASRLPVEMASMFLFICSKPSTDARLQV